MTTSLTSRVSALLVAAFVVGCSGTAETSSPLAIDVDSGDSNDAASIDGAAHDSANALDASNASDAHDGGDASADGGNGCEVYGAPGECMLVSACAAIPDHTSYSNACPGPASIECCIKTPNPADNPPTPTGYKLMSQADVTPAMTTWAVMILHDPVTYPMFSTTTMTFGALMVLARVEWHVPDFQNSIVHRGVTLYEPLP